ncbi:RES family NAD+ phosphorylase [Pelagibacterium luteolum]|uniref:RES family NAD+ phosphorylase n=1 Tax=Pelagibacterium luteolum TaxID=440168 RepID=UPI00115F7AD5
MGKLVGFSGPVWRLIPATAAATPAMPATAIEGRFHHSGQTAAYASLSVEGTAVAIKRYLNDGVSRVLVPMWLEAPFISDQRENPEASIVWQDARACGEVAPTWAVSDRARAIGALAMLYSSRSRPDLTHVVVFDPACLTYVGPTTVFKP